MTGLPLFRFCCVLRSTQARRAKGQSVRENGKWRRRPLCDDVCLIAYARRCIKCLNNADLQLPLSYSPVLMVFLTVVVSTVSQAKTVRLETLTNTFEQTPVTQNPNAHESASGIHQFLSSQVYAFSPSGPPF